MATYTDEVLKNRKFYVKKFAEEIREKMKGSTLYGFPICVFGADGVIVSAYLMSEMRYVKLDTQLEKGE